VYANELIFWQDVVVKTPNNARAHNNYGYALALNCREAEALRHFGRSVELGDVPRFKAEVNLALLRRQRLFEPGERACERQGER
jgi:protein O-mannosyl-transferase